VVLFDPTLILRSALRYYAPVRNNRPLLTCRSWTFVYNLVANVPDSATFFENKKSTSFSQAFEVSLMAPPLTDSPSLSSDLRSFFPSLILPSLHFNPPRSASFYT